MNACDGRGSGAYDGLGSDEGVSVPLVVEDLPRLALGFEAFVVPEARAQVIPPKTWDRKSSSCEGR